MLSVEALSITTISAKRVSRARRAARPAASFFTGMATVTGRRAVRPGLCPAWGVIDHLPGCGWLDWRGHDIAPLFCPIYQGKAINRNPSATTVKRLIKTTAERVGLDPSVADEFSGHSLRVGAAQDLLAAGHDTIAIMRAGGWKSVNVLARYLEHAEYNVWEAVDGG